MTNLIEASKEYHEKGLDITAAYDPIGHVNRYNALVEVSPSCKVKFAGYVGMGPIKRLYVDTISNEDADSLIQFAAWLVVSQSWLIEQIEGLFK